MGDVVKRFAHNSDDVRLAIFKRVHGLGSMTRCCNNWNVLHFSFAHFQRIIDFANSYNVLAGTNLIKVIVPTGSCHCLADKVQRLIRLHLEKRDSDPDKGSGMADDTTSQVGSIYYRGGHYE